MKIFTNIKANYGKYLARCVGAAAVGLVGYDSHVLGKVQSDVYAKRCDANAVARTYANTMFMNDPSLVQSKVRKSVNNFEMDNNIRTFFNSAIGYVKGFGSMMINEVIPLGLGVGALFAKNKTAAKGCGWGLAAYAAFSFLKNGLGLGHYNDINSKF